jgi:hypothetical protein
MSLRPIIKWDPRRKLQKRGQFIGNGCVPVEQFLFAIPDVDPTLPKAGPSPHPGRAADRYGAVVVVVEDDVVDETPHMT